MNIKRNVAIGLAVAWLLIAHFGSHEHADIVGVIVANIWLAAAQVSGSRK